MLELKKIMFSQLDSLELRVRKDYLSATRRICEKWVANVKLQSRISEEAARKTDRLVSNARKGKFSSTYSFGGSLLEGLIAMQQEELAFMESKKTSTTKSAAKQKLSRRERKKVACKKR